MFKGDETTILELVIIGTIIIFMAFLIRFLGG